MATLKQTLDLAMQQHQAGRLLEAESNYRIVLAERPDYPDALHLLGLTLHLTGRHELALEQIGKAVSLRPNTALFHASLSAVFLALGHSDQAIIAAQRAVDLQPQLPQAWLNLGNALATAGKYEPAIHCFGRVVQLQPANAAAFLGWGNVLGELKQPDEAIAAYRQAIALQPNFPDAHFNLGNVLSQQENYHAALGCYRQAISLQPDHLGAINNSAVSLLRMGKLEDALACLRQALADHPAVPRLHNDLGNILSEANRLSDAMQCYQRALDLNGDFHEARYNLATMLLAVGDFERGWREYEVRWLYKTPLSQLRYAAMPRWRGEPLQGQRILLHFEQGFGDTLQFIRFVPLVAQLGGQVILQVQPQLHRLLQNTQALLG